MAGARKRSRVEAPPGDSPPGDSAPARKKTKTDKGTGPPADSPEASDDESTNPITESGTPDRTPTITDPARHLGAAWVFKAVLGKGGGGEAQLWVRQDDSANIIERAVVKDVPCTETEFHECFWNQSRAWMGGDMVNRIPVEFGLPHELNPHPQSSNIINSRSYQVDILQESYRIYVEYCEHGSLQKMLDAAVNESRRIPARVVWAAFEALTRAVCLVHDGRLPTDSDAARSFSYMHGDIKPDNVFLASPDPATWKDIPVMKLADFGHAVLAKHDHASTLAFGTQGHMAPEQVTENDGEGSYEGSYEITTAIDIWAIGRVLTSLMNGEEGPSEQLNLENDPDEPTFNPSVEDDYGSELCTLVRRCLQQDPDERPNAKELWREVNAHVAQSQPPAGQNNGNAGSGETLPMKLWPSLQDEGISYPKDLYPMLARQSAGETHEDESE